jgi:enoyl-CoA hydratase
MGWLQGAIWSNAHVRGAVASMKTKKPADFPALAPLQGFRDLA